jgi:hypothetical protein
MKYFFNKDELEKEKGKILVLTDDIKYDDIKDHFEEVDLNGEELEDDDTVKNNQDNQEQSDEKKDDKDNTITNAPKKKKNKKK